MIKLNLTAFVDHAITLDIEYDESLIGNHKYSDCLNEDIIAKTYKKLIRDIKNNDVNFELEVSEEG